MKTLIRYVETWQDNPRVGLGLIGFCIGLVGIGLMQMGIFPLGTVNLTFFTVLLFLLALYRPNWVFLGLVAVLPFETLDILPDSLGISLRPYQWFFVILSCALVIRSVSKRVSWSGFHFSPLDFWLALIPFGALLSGFVAGGVGRQTAIVVVSFYAVYLLGRFFLRASRDVEKSLIVFVASGFVSLGFGILQNIAFEQGSILGSVMPGRPNGTFAEPDWFGYFAAVVLVLVFTQITHFLRLKPESPTFRLMSIASAVGLTTFVLIALILSVSRSAWLAAGVALIVWFGLALFRARASAIRLLLQSLQVASIAFVLAVLIIIDIPLTRFDLLNRAGSTATGLQEITVACPNPTELPETIASVEELSRFGCRHINLEEREALASVGQSIQMVQRSDPNVVIRGQIYRKSWDEIRDHPWLGIGWGNIGTVLGRDEQGAAFNASNLWLEVWLGAGALGLFGLIGSCGVSIYQSFYALRRRTGSMSSEGLIVPLLALLVLFVVFNLFNAGLLIGFVWMGFACIPTLIRGHDSETV